MTSKEKKDMPLTFYTVLTEEDGAPSSSVKYIKPQEPHNLASYYGRTQTFTIPEHTFGDPGEASQEFKACVGGQNACYLPPAQFRRKVKALHKLSQGELAQGDHHGEDTTRDSQA